MKRAILCIVISLYAATAMYGSEEEKDSIPFNLRTNLVGWALLAPNIGVEMPFARHWSALVETGWAHLDWKHDARRYRLWFLSPEVRYHFSPRTEDGPHAYAGIYYATGEYNYHLSGPDGKQGYFHSTGISGGYIVPLSERLNVDFGLALGYTHDRYHRYTYQTDRDFYQKTARGNHFGPTKVWVSLVWKFNQ